ncbi:hypothetical protein JCM33374_g5738 [Metschnikowia sp. JCM 33374]|nr:hypothetical protein JCM33374_g5738 [Metschnikowia sp. JCM 33374]
MSLIAITRVGICASDEGSLVSKSLLLSRFNISVFFRKCTVAWLINQNSSKQQESLFPEIKQSHVSNLTNTFKGMAIVCAADDLELSFSGETGQIEIFDNFVSTDPQQFIHNQMEFSNGKNSLNTAHFPTFEKSLSSELGSSYHSSHFGMEDYSPNSVSSANSQTVRFPYDHSQHNRNQPERSFVNINNNALPEFGFDFMANHQSHYDMMATGVDMSTQFTDFKHGSFNDALSCGSSIDSFESPLDEMFFPVPPFRSNVNSSGVTASSNPRKRKIESPIAPDFGFPSPGAVFKKTSPPYEAQKRIKSEVFQPFPSRSASTARAHEITP